MCIYWHLLFNSCRAATYKKLSPCLNLTSVTPTWCAKGYPPCWIRVPGSCWSWFHFQIPAGGCSSFICRALGWLLGWVFITCHPCEMRMVPSCQPHLTEAPRLSWVVHSSASHSSNLCNSVTLHLSCIPHTRPTVVGTAQTLAERQCLLKTRCKMKRGGS